MEFQKPAQEATLQEEERGNKGRGVTSLMGIILILLLALVAIFWVLKILGVEPGTILAGEAVVVLILGFGAESIIADLVTGAFLTLEKPYDLGDIIEVEGFRGKVDRMGLRTTWLRDGGGNIKILNNSQIRNLTNLSRRGSVAVCDLPLPYQTDLRQARRALEEKLLPALSEHHPELFPETPQFLGVQELGERSVILRVIAQVEEQNRFAAERWMREELKTGLEEQGMGYAVCPAPAKQAES